MASSIVHASKGQKERKENEVIASLDPLNADGLIGQIPDLNKNKDVNSLVFSTKNLMPSWPDLQEFDYYQANAAIRDIGILLGSIKRHGVEPYTVIPDLEAKMKHLATKTSMPPRDTLLHYTVWNPAGDRKRMYTGTADEHYLIDSVVTAIDPLVCAIYLLKELHYTPLHSGDFERICDQVVGHFQKVIDGMVLARRNVSLSYFATELRLYFDPIMLDGREYLGPGAVEMPMFVFDQLLWSCDCDDVEYQIFKKTYLPYVHPEMRKIYIQYQNRDSLLGKCYKNIVKKNIDFDPSVYTSMRALRMCFQQLKSFRMPHKKVAEEAYAHTSGEHHGCDHVKNSISQDYRANGSGGYSPDILSNIVKLTNQKTAKLDACIAFYELKAGRSFVYPGS
ncbi:monodechloroaminopyrrolnitrin synthase PrnB family protein [Dyadobacter sp. MSC1_007]|jgi:hypothetical protein|uniref:monodechloroaminopyrrolnitrin synthase PrnB family protein n=1 Tax=Dyadobacter sp. MSC1_007 TaxID=2909264 RepID=UPI00202F6F66|nr:monodechloroaminopyrrolnitrin synthase PrnB family protein [Dyadobacter sp. MSC1_007]